MTIGLKGHVLGPAFPEGYSNWQKTDLHDLIDAELIKEPTDKNVVKAIKKVAKEADELVIATDFDREGELIGLEALEEMLDANPELGSREGTARRHLRRSSAPATRPSPRRRSSAPSATSTSSPTRSPTPAPPARTSTCSGARP